MESREAELIEVELYVSGIKQARAMALWKYVRNRPLNVRYPVARDYIDALKRHQRAERAWIEHVSRGRLPDSPRQPPDRTLRVGFRAG